MKKVVFLLVFSLLKIIAFAQEKKQVDVLKNIAIRYAIKEKNDRQALLIKAKQKGWALAINVNNNIATLTGIDIKGFPVYTQVDNNITSAITTKTNLLWTNPYNVNGSSINMKGKLGIWDKGSALVNHIELDGRILNKNNVGSDIHSTHVGGTLVASGVNPLAKGMAWGAEQLISYDYDFHISEIATEASNLLLSNHSYGVLCGWNKDGLKWKYFGLPGDTADYKFGIYDEETQMLDSIAYYAPNYLIVKSVGNCRDKNGPAVGDFCYMYGSGGDSIWQPRPAGIYSNDGYDIIPTYGVAKNVLTIGEIEGTTGNIDSASNIKLASESSWGPTDDGRIKPDLVAAGVNVYSCTNESTTSYGFNSGTSMATPNVAGSLFLLQELYSQKNNDNFMKASTLKALAIATATDAGRAKGPDYEYGWGLLNAEKCGNAILDATKGKAKILDTLLQNNQTITIPVKADGSGKLIATIAWTDVPGKVTTTNILNNPSLKLINDIDIRIIKNSTTYFPWILNPAKPADAATTGDNFRDNVERIDIDSTSLSDSFLIQISHKSNLVNGSQRVGLVITGIDDSVYCKPYTTSLGNIKIDSFKFNDLQVTTATCNGYDDYKNLHANVQPGSLYNMQIGLSSCTGNHINKAVKLFIDYNEDKKFDNTELVFRSNIFSNDTVLNTLIPVSNFAAVGKTVLMRLIAVETNDYSSFNACDATTIYGTTQDFSIVLNNPMVDIAVVNIETPNGTLCSNTKQLISVNLINKGRVAVSNFRVTATVKQNGNTIYISTEVVTTTIQHNENFIYTFQKPFETSVNNTYSINVTTDLMNDQLNDNNSTTSIITTQANATQISGQAKLCRNIVQLSAINAPLNQSYAWYANPDTTKLIASGTDAVSTVLSNKYFSQAGANISVGAVDKSISSNGDYQDKGGNYFYYKSEYDLVLQSAKLYTAHAGTLNIIAADTVKTYSDGRYDYKILSSKTIDVAASNPNVQSGYVHGNDSADKGLYYNINLLLPKGNHILIVKTDSIANVFRNSEVAANLYPFKAGNLISFYKTNASKDSFYYYLYDMKLATLDCESERLAIIPTNAVKPVITKFGDSLQSSLGNAYQWYLNSNIIANATNQFYKINQNGSYTVAVTDGNGCEQMSDAFVIGKAEPYTDFKLYPNPAKNDVWFSIDNINANYAKAYIYDVVGRIVAAKSFIVTTNNFTGYINTLGLKNDFYMVQIITANKTYNSRLIISR